MNQLHIECADLLQPTSNPKEPFALIRDGVIVYDDVSIQYAGPCVSAPKEFRSRVMRVAGRSSSDLKVAIPPFVDTHHHAFQPVWTNEPLIKDTPSGPVGSLPKTLQFESLVRHHPEEARAICKELLETSLRHGVVGRLEYTTSSIPALRMLLETARDMDLSGYIKAGYVFMDQKIDSDGVKLEMKQAEAPAIFQDLLKLNSEFPGSIVVIDRFPIAVSSPLRRRLVEFCKQNGFPYETHVNEAEDEANYHHTIYGARILATLAQDGVFSISSRIGFAHGILTTEADEILLQGQIQTGAEVAIHLCPTSNAHLGSHVIEEGSEYAPMPLERWMRAGALPCLGTDEGAGPGMSLAAVALAEMGRWHAEGYRPSALDVLRFATRNGWAHLNLPRPDHLLQTGGPASFLVVKPHQQAILQTMRSHVPSLVDAERVALHVLAGAQDPTNIRRVVVGGQILR